MTLLEIVLAVALFFGAVAVLGQVTWNGSRAAVQGRLKTEAVIRCETKMAELLAGIEPLEAASNAAFADDPSWTWSAAMVEGSFPELLQLEVRVRRTGTGTLGNVDYSLKKWVRDPSIFMGTTASDLPADDSGGSGMPQ